MIRFLGSILLIALRASPSVADDGSFKSPALAKDQEWSHKFDKAESYSYAINEHPSAKGKVIVK